MGENISTQYSRVIKILFLKAYTNKIEIVTGYIYHSACMTNKQRASANPRPKGTHALPKGLLSNDSDCYGLLPR